MRFLSLMALCLALTACYPCAEYDHHGDRVLYRAQNAEDGYKPVSSGRIFNVAGYKIEEAQQMRDFFDDFEEPMHAKYMGDDVILWTYYVNPKNGKIVRYCELDKFAPHSLCKIDVEFYRTYVRNATTTCK